jgi:hypothetical protein
MRKVFLILQWLTFSLVVSAQEEIPAVPEVKNWEDKLEVASLESHVIDMLNWLTKTPLSEHVVERSELSYFVLEWLTRTPSIQVVIQMKSFEQDFLTKEDMQLAYIEGCSLYALKHKSNGNQKSQDMAGLKVVAFMAESSKTYYKEAVFKDLIRAVKKNHLDELYDDYTKTKSN